ncbi:MAG TPA: PBP1A family penicillin-binding protein [Thermoanaerobaculia bacterium]|nr:PBP1A family penicillin-binding protein [Thermoanaerobaculia bacterium]
MSRVRLPPWTVVVALIIFAATQWLSVYLFLLNRRIGRELVSRNWRHPTVILSAAPGAEGEVLRVYGAGWSVTEPVALDSLPPHVPNAFLAAEDVRFRSHPGVDPIGIARAAVRNVRARGITEGGSTINQQVVRARYLSQERTWRRKAIEMIVAVLLDVRLSKDDILELYLNDVYLGHHDGRPVLGIDEAALLYFGKSPARLSVDEAALLASIVRAPNRDTPRKRPDLVRARRNAILAVMHDRDWITGEQLRLTRERPVEFTGGSLPVRPYPYYVRALRGEVVRQLGVRRLVEGGLTIVCEIDPQAQRGAERAVRNGLSALAARHSWIRRQARADPLQAALFSVDPRSGGVRALVGGADFRRSPLDRTRSMSRQPGSAFKTFAYLAAIDSRRATTASLLLDSPLTVRLGGDDTWEPQNYDEKFRGRVTLREAFEKSLNVPAVRLTQEVGLGRVAGTAEKFEFAGRIDPIPALALGVAEVTVRELTAAYTAFPTLGVRVEPYLLTEIRDRRDAVLFRHKAREKRVCDAAPAYVMHSLLRGVVRRGTGSRLKRYGLDHAAGKTGTTSDYRDAWFVGYTADLVTTVWVGFDRGAPLRLSSAEAAIPIWGQYMSAVPHSKSEPEAPAGVTFRNIDPETGMVWAEGCPGPVRDVFLEGTAPTRTCPRGIIGRIVRRVLFDAEHFDEPPAITFEKFRRWADEVDRNRKAVEGWLDRMRRWFDD